MGIFKTGSESKPDLSSANGWHPLYKFGGMASSTMAAIILLQFVAFMAWQPPLDGGITDWFKLFQDNWIAGLISFELLMVIYTVLAVFVSLSLYIALHRLTPSLMIIYLALSIVGIISFISARPFLEMLSLSNQYAVAGTEAQKAIFLAAGEGMLAAFHGTNFHISYILGSVSGLFVSIAMLQTNIFSKKIAYLRIASSVFDFGLYVPTVGLYISIFSVLFLLIWNILIAKRLFQLGRGKD